MPKAGRGDRQGAEQRQWHPLARQGRQVLGRRHPGPSPKRPVKLEAISEPQVPRGPRGTQDRPPASPARCRVEDPGATAARSEFRGAAPRDDSGWGRRGAHRAAWGRVPAISPSFHPCHPSRLFQHLRRLRAGDAAELGWLRRLRRRQLLRGSPRRRAVEGKPWCRGEGTRLVEGRLRRRG